MPRISLFNYRKAGVTWTMTHTFGQCELDPERRVLRKNGRDVHVEPQVFDLLLALIDADGAVVTKDALVETVWRGLHVSDATISSRINAARKAVGDSGKAQAVIRTLANWPRF